MMGDSHAALYGHGVRAPGTVKATYRHRVVPDDPDPQPRRLDPRPVRHHRLDHRHGTAYALEGNITVSAQAAAFMAQLLGLPDAAALSALAQTVPDAGGVTFVPALAGLGAPHWDDARHRHHHRHDPCHHPRPSGPRHVRRHRPAGRRCLRRDGGGYRPPPCRPARRWRCLVQCVPDAAAGRPPEPPRHPRVAEVGALGAAAMAFAALGVDPLAVLSGTGQARTFTPAADPATRDQTRARWQAAIRRALAS